jgi:DNA-binding response OmpR family regulator
MKILVIDDNPAFRYSLAGALGKGGYQVVMADDGEHGLVVFRNENPDLVICDLVMPRRNGIDTIQQIRRESPAMKIIAISGGAVMMNVEGLATALESGADDVIVKPFDSEDLLIRVTQVLLGI